MQLGKFKSTGFNLKLEIHETLELDKFKDADFKCDNKVLKFWSKSTQKRHFWSPSLAFLFFHKVLQLDKFEGADFKNDNIIFKFQPKNI